MIDISSLPVFISVKQAAVLLGFSRATAYRMAENNVLPVRRIGGRIYIETAELQAFIDGIGLDDEQIINKENTQHEPIAKKIPGITVDQRGKKWGTGSKGATSAHRDQATAQYRADSKPKRRRGKLRWRPKSALRSADPPRRRRSASGDYLKYWLDANETNSRHDHAELPGQHRRLHQANPRLAVVARHHRPTLNEFYKHLSRDGRQEGRWQPADVRVLACPSVGERDGDGPLPRDIAEACGTKLDHAARGQFGGTATTECRRRTQPGSV